MPHGALKLGPRVGPRGRTAERPQNGPQNFHEGFLMTEFCGQFCGHSAGTPAGTLLRPPLQGPWLWGPFCGPGSAVPGLPFCGPGSAVPVLRSLVGRSAVPVLRSRFCGPPQQGLLSQLIIPMNKGQQVPLGASLNSDPQRSASFRALLSSEIRAHSRGIRQEALN